MAFGAAAGAGAAGAAAGVVTAGLRPIGCTDVPMYGDTSSGSPFSAYDVRSSVTVMVGAPVSFSFVPGAGVCFATLFTA